MWNIPHHPLFVRTNNGISVPKCCDSVGCLSARFRIICRI
ncbi:hypothetical protein HMPREF1317_1445 [Schaalia georgiae F0490]|uniref:Uncharacterized protein n=1 Tax=Schaalia georgiae F0490 TaxID=1125717 RepID=J0NW27_9ACTO|nr:hypothetical protein HMPREF1317_1445 [Schaalia georgiae F0490]